MEDGNRSIAYFKMHKNLTTDLKPNEGYLSWSEKCHNEANAYFEVLFRCKGMIHNDYRNAFFTNVSFNPHRIYTNHFEIIKADYKNFYRSFN
ncbi:hypothetical protein [Lysinibacillus sp. IITD104]|uniref:hypothetical protein n=1 Tax=Lysinibacillus sp. IITD104 TaxID=3116650 RepID=UPI002FD0598D